FRVEAVEVGVAASAGGKLALARLALGLAHAAPLLASFAGDDRTRALPDVRVAQLQIRHRGGRTGQAAVDPQPVRELVPVPIGAGQQVPGRSRRAPASLALRVCPPGAADVFELGQVRPERVRVRVREPWQRAEEVTAGAT